MSLEGLEGLIKGLENQPSWQAQRQFRLVVMHWPKAVGFAVARQTRPVSIQRATLYVATATAVWAQTLSYERIKILQKLNRYQQQPLKNIRFSTAQWNQQATPTMNNSQEVRKHPSYIPSDIDADQLKGAIANNVSPQTPKEAFERWANKVKQQQPLQSMCPRCHCYCPQGELVRWKVCSLCAAKDMH